jgi:uncharacterized membrane protein
MKNLDHDPKHAWVTRAKHISMLSVLSIAMALLFAGSANAQRKCGAEGQRPCKIWERIPSCNKGLYEDFRLKMCVGEHTPVDARTGKYLPQPKSTDLNLCNRSSRPTIYVAVAQYVDADAGWISRGWFNVPAGRCSKIEIDKEYSGSVYVYGSAADGTEWDGGDAKFCVNNSEPFEFDNADRINCAASDSTIVGMAKLDVRPGTNTWNFGN